jgi:hypothetical protein
MTITEVHLVKKLLAVIESMTSILHIDATNRYIDLYFKHYGNKNKVIVDLYFKQKVKQLKG